MSQKILVTGATGTVGSEVVKSLQARGASFIAASRETAKAEEKLGPGVPVVAFDFADPATFAAATQGVDAVFLLGPPLDTQLDRLLTPFVQHLKQQGINRVVYLSSLGADKMGGDMAFHTNVENQLKQEGFALTILRPSFFAQNFKNYEWENIVDRKVTFTPAGQGKVAFVDIRDVGEVAAKILLEDGHANQEYVLTGGESLSYQDAAHLLTQIRQEPIVYPAPSPEEYSQALGAAGAPPFIADYMNKVYSLISKGHVDYVSPDIERLLGRKPGSLRAVLESSFGK